jgi:hypothetical protein
MLAENWYRSLARVNRLIVRVRDRIENLTVHISELERDERSTGSATARLHRFEVMLELMSDHRAVILEKAEAIVARDALVSGAC